MKELKPTNSARVVLMDDDIAAMAQQDTDAMIGVSGRWWKFPGAEIETDSWEVEWRDGKMHLHDDDGNVIEGVEVNNPEDIAGVLAVPSPEERRRREILLARLMLVAIDIVLAGDPLGLETARDLVREVEHAYPELVTERGEL